MSNKIRKIVQPYLILISLFFYPILSHANLKPAITQGLNHIIQNFGQDINIGMMVQSMATGEILYQRKINLVFAPASSMKLFTAIAALKYLGPDYQFTTIVATDAAANDAVNNLYIKFTGDPTLTIDDLNKLITILAQHNIKTINGNLIIDNTRLDKSNWAPGWTLDETHICYAAPVTAVIINHNCFDFNLIPGKQTNAPTALQFLTNYAGATVVNQTATRITQPWDCLVDLTMSADNHYQLTGCVAPNNPPIYLEVALNNPGLAAANILQLLLKQQGIILRGNIITSKMPIKANVLITHHSPPLSAIITDMLKKSDNLMADVLLKTLGANYFHDTGTWANGAVAVRVILATATGIDFDKLVMVDGSGLSRYDLVTPRQFMQLIRYAYKDLPANKVFYHALPVMGIDGTLKNRLANTPYAGKVHAKTGSMDSTSTLVGYINTNSKQMLAFTILINGFVGSQTNYHHLENQLCEFLINNG